MKKYALVVNGRVSEIFHQSDGDLPLEQRLPKAMINDLVEIGASQHFSVKPGMMYDGTNFFVLPPPVLPTAETVTQYIPIYIVRERLEAEGNWPRLVELLSQDMPTMLRVLTLQSGIDPKDLQARALIQAIGSDPDIIFAPPQAPPSEGKSG